ncbi:MAG TPA: cysteine peptidase family C39 domain-containing protein [Planctomycetota bacterium]|nr:cysteine peptidase family C39 domain-containing protein [Planctomycetota bacterium]
MPAARRRVTAATVALIAAIAGGGAATGCSAPQRTLPAGSIELPVDPVRQSDAHDCGAATLDALAAYHGARLDDESRRQLAECAAGSEGLTGADLRSALEPAGLDVFLFRGTPDHAPTGLWRALEGGLPPVVAISSAPGRNHFVLLVGYDPRSGDVAVLDPAQGRLVIPADRFLDCWRGAERFTLLAVPSRPSFAPSFAPSYPTEDQP